MHPYGLVEQREPAMFSAAKNPAENAGGAPVGRTCGQLRRQPFRGGAGADDYRPVPIDPNGRCLR